MNKCLEDKHLADLTKNTHLIRSTNKSFIDQMMAAARLKTAMKRRTKILRSSTCRLERLLFPFPTTTTPVKIDRWPPMRADLSFCQSGWRRRLTILLIASSASTQTAPFTSVN